MRLFVGITPTAEALAHAAGSVDRRVGQAAPDMRWVPSERWHVTLALLGEVDPDGAAEGLRDYAGPEFDVHEIRLVHSITGPTPRRTDLHVARLGARSPGAPAAGRSPQPA